MNNTHYAGGNQLLDRLAPNELLALDAQLDVVQIDSGQVLYPGGAERDLEFVFFPINAVLSVIATLADGSAVEAGTAGHEGMVGAQNIFASSRTFERWIGQVPGSAARIRLIDFRVLVAGNEPLRTVLHRYIQFNLAFLAQSIACNTRHPLVERCARWLLMAHDRANSNRFYLTQEFLATMLGVRRPGVSVAAATLADAGFISYVRGAMTVTDRRGLETAACECYGLMLREASRLLGTTKTPEQIDVLAPHRTRDGNVAQLPESVFDA